MFKNKLVNGYLIENFIKATNRTEIYTCRDQFDKKYIVKSVLYYDNQTNCDIQNEKVVLSSLPKHPHLIKAIENFVVVENNVKFHFFILPFFEADLWHVNFKKLNFFDKLDIIIDIAKGLKFLHSHAIYHGDLKPQNILLKEENSKIIPVICDFGLSDNILVKDAVKNTIPFCTPFDLYNQQYFKTKEQIKTLYEACLASGTDIENLLTLDRLTIEEDGRKSDIFCLGLVMIFIFNNIPLFLEKKIKNKKNNEEEDVKKFCKQYLYFLLDPELYLSLYIGDLPPLLFDIILRMLSINTEYRPTLDIVINQLEYLKIESQKNISAGQKNTEQKNTEHKNSEHEKSNL